MEELLTRLKDWEKGYDRILVNVKVVRMYRDKGFLNKYILEEKLATIMQIALAERDTIHKEIKRIKDEQNLQENLKRKQATATSGADNS